MKVPGTELFAQPDQLVRFALAHPEFLFAELPPIPGMAQVQLVIPNAPNALDIGGRTASRNQAERFPAPQPSIQIVRTALRRNRRTQFHTSIHVHFSCVGSGIRARRVNLFAGRVIPSNLIVNHPLDATAPARRWHFG
jgi:CDP-diacylglycerol pyrophosphatase